MTERPPSVVASTLVLFTLFFGGGFVGERLALALAPTSGVSRLLGFIALPASLILGFFAWAGAATLVMVVQLATGGRRSQLPRDIPPGANGFLWSSALTCLFVGVVTGILSREHGFLFVSSVYVATGIVYGGLCWRLAKSGWLPFPVE